MESLVRGLLSLTFFHLAYFQGSPTVALSAYFIPFNGQIILPFINECIYHIFFIYSWVSEYLGHW